MGHPRLLFLLDALSLTVPSPLSWSFLESSQTVSVVPFRHDEYPRFIFGAWPYYLGAASTTVAFLVFGALWLRLPREAVAKGKKDE